MIDSSPVPLLFVRSVTLPNQHGKVECEGVMLLDNTPAITCNEGEWHGWLLSGCNQFVECEYIEPRYLAQGVDEQGLPTSLIVSMKNSLNVSQEDVIKASENLIESLYLPSTISNIEQPFWISSNPKMTPFRFQAYIRLLIRHPSEMPDFRAVVEYHNRNINHQPNSAILSFVNIARKILIGKNFYIPCYIEVGGEGVVSVIRIRAPKGFLSRKNGVFLADVYCSDKIHITDRNPVISRTVSFSDGFDSVQFSCMLVEIIDILKF